MATHTEDQKSWVETVDNVAIDGKENGDATAFVEGTDEEKRLVRKVDMWLMPTIWILYCFSYMARSLPLGLIIGTADVQSRTERISGTRE